jgi:carboxylesterase
VPLIPGAEPYSHDGGEVGVLVIHGFSGSPKSMRPWAEHLAGEGFTVRLPRLPGHGTTWQEMNLTRWEDWYGEADRAFDELAARCSTVFVVGLSMGATLTLRFGETKGDAVAGLVLVNPAVHTERKDRFLLPLIYRFVPAFPGITNDIAKPGQDEGGYNRIPLRAAHSMNYGLWPAVRADIAKITQPVLLYRSAVDHVVEPSNVAWILGHIGSHDVEERLLPRSYHVATLDYDAPDIFTGSVEFIRKHAPAAAG